jgi:hypothetical protein
MRMQFIVPSRMRDEGGYGATGIDWRSSDSGGATLADQTFDEGDKRLTRAWQDELLHPRIPVELEARGQRGDPYLVQRRIGSDNESGAVMIEENVEDAVPLLHFECDLLFVPAHDEMALQSIERGPGSNSKLMIILHGVSVASSVRRSRRRELP